MTEKIVGLLFSGIFALGFGVAGFLGASQLWSLADGAMRSDRMVGVQAQRLIPPAGDKKPRAIAYRYTYEGQTYISARETFRDGKTLAENAKTSLTTDGKALTIWVDPQNPSVAVIDKNVRLFDVLFMLPFGILFPLVGIGAGYYFVKTLFTPKQKLNRVEAAPNPNEIKPESSGIAHSVAGVLLTIIAAPFFAAGWMGGAPFPFKIISIALLIAAFSLIVNGIRTRFAHRRSIAPRLTLTPTQPEIGRAVRVRIRLPRPHAPRALSLALVQKKTDATGPGSSLSHSQTQRGFVAQRVSESAHESVFEATVTTDADAKPTVSVPGGVSIDWVLRIEASEGISRYDFPLTLRAASAFNSHFAPIEIVAPVDAQASFEIPKSVVAISQNGRERTYIFPPRGWTTGPLCLTALALTLCTWGVHNLVRGADATTRLEMIAVFSFAVIALYYALHFAYRRVRVVISPAGLVSSIQSPVWPATHTRIALAHIKNFNEKIRYQSGGNSSVVIELTRTRDTAIAITPVIENTAVRNAIARSFADAFADVKGYGITPLPEAKHASLVRPIERIFTLSIVFAAIALIALAYVNTKSAESHDTEKIAVSCERIQRDADTKDAAARDAALVEAIDSCDAPVIATLLANGANANAIGNKGNTALMRAAHRGDLEKVNLLLKHGANVNQSIAPPNKRAGANALGDALYGEHLAIAQVLVDAGARTNDNVCCGWTLAHVAAEKGCVQCLEFLAKHNAPLDQFASASRGETPMMVAARFGNHEAIRWLITHGADPNKRDPYGYNVAGWAAFFKQTKTRDLLRELGADLDTTSRGATKFDDAK